MPVSAKGYGQFLKLALSTHPVNLISDTVKVMLCSSEYTPDQDNHATKADVTYEIAGEGYSAGGKALTNKTLTYDASTNTVVFDADDVVWQNATITARYAVLYVDKGTQDNEKPLIGYIDFGADKSSENGDFALIWSQDGIIRLSTP